MISLLAILEGFIHFPWGLLLLIPLAIYLLSGRGGQYCHSLCLSRIWLLFLLFILLAGAFFMPGFRMGGRRVFFNIGVLFGLVGPSIYWLSKGPLAHSLCAILAASILAGLRYLLNIGLFFHLSQYMPLPLYLTLPLSAAFAWLVAGERKQAYAALVLGRGAGALALSCLAATGVVEIGNFAFINETLAAFALVELFIFIRRALRN